MSTWRSRCCNSSPVESFSYLAKSDAGKGEARLTGIAMSSCEDMPAILTIRPLFWYWHWLIEDMPETFLKEPVLVLSSGRGVVSDQSFDKMYESATWMR